MKYKWTLQRESACDRNNIQSFLLCRKGSIDFYFYRKAFTNVLSILKLLSKSLQDIMFFDQGCIFLLFSANFLKIKQNNKLTKHNFVVKIRLNPNNLYVKTFLMSIYPKNLCENQSVTTKPYRPFCGFVC